MFSLEAKCSRVAVSVAALSGLLTGSAPVELPDSLFLPYADNPALVGNFSPHEIVTGYAPDQNAILLQCREGNRIGENARVVNVFGPLRSDFAEKIIADAAHVNAQGKALMVSLGEDAGGGKLTLEDLVARRDEIVRIAKAFGEMNGVAARFLYEPNGWWFSYGTQTNDPGDFRNMWNYVAGIFREYAPETKLVLSLNVTRIDQRYPIEAYLGPDLDYDAVGLDGYIFEYRAGPVSITWPKESMVGVFLPDVKRIRRVTDKPVIITEVGSARAPEDWYREGLSALSSLPPEYRPTGVFFFNWNKEGFGETRWGDGLEREQVIEAVFQGISQGGYYDGPSDSSAIMDHLFDIDYLASRPPNSNP